MEALQALIDQLNLDYPGGNNPTADRTALLAKADDAAAPLGQKIFLGVDDLWYSIDAKQFPKGKIA